MKQRFFIALVASLFTTAAAGQAEPDVPRTGSWVATIQPADGSRQIARYVLREFSGQWIGAGGRTPVTGRACAGKKLPITVQKSTAGALDFTVWGSQVSPKCADLTIETQVVGDDVFEGTLASGGTIRLTRR